MDTTRLTAILHALEAIAERVRARGLGEESDKLAELARELTTAASAETRVHTLPDRWEAEAARSDALVRESSGSVRDSAKSRAAGIRLCIRDLHQTLAEEPRRRS